MNDEVTIKRRGWLLGILAIFVLVAWWPEFGTAKFRPTTCPEAELCVAFLDVGQGDAIFVQSPDGTQLLIDGGRDNSVLSGLGEVMKFSDRSLDYVLLTHPDSDHIAGLVPILERYQVANVIRTENESDTAIWNKLEKAISIEDAQVYYARRGQRYQLGEGVLLDILFPNLDATELESNTSSVVARLVYGDTSFMLTGDSPQAIENYLVLLDETSLDSDVLKVGHHGSRTSTAEEFVAAVSPVYAVISSGQDNSYGHPHKEVLETLSQEGLIVISTAEMGNIIFSSDGHTIRLLSDN